MKQIEEWKAEEVKAWHEAYEATVQKDREWAQKYGWHRYEYENYRREVNQTLLKLRDYSKEARAKKIEKLVNDHFNQLQAKVEKKIGKIVEIQPVNGSGYDYWFIGESGGCGIELIIAGGWNIQRRHTRWIIK